MDMQASAQKGANLIILEGSAVRAFPLDAREEWLIGRSDPGTARAPDIPLSSAIASREHGWLRKVGGHWYFLDNPKNTNGTLHNNVRIPRPRPGMVESALLKNGDILRIDSQRHDSASGVMMLFTLGSSQGTWETLSLSGRTELLIGRSTACDIVEPLPYISSKHAKITFENGRYCLSDCASKAGTFLNGQRVTGPVPLHDRDCICLCDCSYFFLGSQLLFLRRSESRRQAIRELNPSQRPVVLKADIATKRVKDNNGSGMKELIRDIHLEIREGTLVALLGTAGAGKSTVMNCLNGMDLEGVQGSVLYRDVDLMQHFDRMKSLIGSVPQKKVFHKTFTPEQEFRLAAQKRLPADTTKQEIEERVDRTLEMLSMTGVRKNRNSKLSGGEQTRVNVGIELVADRDLLCLDEPDQGLSPNYKHELFEIMGSLAHKNGKSVLSIIHDVSEIDMFDQVIMLAKVDGVGRLAFSGTPAEAKQFFGVDIKDAYALLEKNPKQFVR